jgi:lactate permease
MVFSRTAYQYVSLLLSAPEPARSSADGERYIIECAVRQSSADHGGAARHFAGARGGLEQPGGVMGKIIDAQSIVVASVATNQHGSEGSILRYAFFHSLALAVLLGLLVLSQAYVFPGVVLDG